MNELEISNRLERYDKFMKKRIELEDKVDEKMDEKMEDMSISAESNLDIIELMTIFEDRCRDVENLFVCATKTEECKHKVGCTCDDDDYDSVTSIKSEIASNNNFIVTLTTTRKIDKKISLKLFFLDEDDREETFFYLRRYMTKRNTKKVLLKEVFDYDGVLFTVNGSSKQQENTLMFSFNFMNYEIRKK